MNACTRRPATAAPTKAYYSNGIIGFDFEIGATHFNDTGSGTRRATPASSRCSALHPDEPVLNEGFHKAMEFASGNYGLLHESLDYANDTTAPFVDAVSTPANGVARLELRGALRERRGGVDLLHDRWLDADDGLDGVQAAKGAGTTGGARAAGRHDAQVDRA